jgi:hypothetical protein
MECHALEEAKAGDFTIFPRFVVDLTVFFPSGVQACTVVFFPSS